MIRADRPRAANGTDKIGYGASFCDGRLIWISHDYKANIGKLFELLSDLKSSYGAPTVDLGCRTSPLIVRRSRQAAQR
jgi:hypothetical protein